MNLQEWIARWFTSNGNNGESNKKFVQFISFSMWQIWNLRCNVEFNSAQVQVTNLINQVHKDISDWNANSVRLLNSRNTPSNSRIVSPWSLTDFEFQKFNFDAYFIKENKHMGIGLINFNDAGICGGAQSIHGIANDEEHDEALAALAAIRWEKAEAVQKLHLEGDFLNVVSAINGSLGSVKWTNNNVIQDCGSLLDSFSSWKCTLCIKSPMK
ncbi:uncharacterized protein LOC113351415 [Papaver somniferum]|uniref:uncharacterized protein LOC113351415 n=1 Tax=Papaver somniferum TaxID=3469 RepID=UPI000E70204A|nr:uncharacterized protein LOC113351415 [Papaver somniferum]